MARGDFKRRMEASQRQMLEWARGRNGADELSGACTNVAVVLVIVDLFAHTTWLSILALVLLGYSWFRITSKRVGARSLENARVLKATGPIVPFLANPVGALREARASVREDFLEHMRPGFYHYVIIFIVASVAGLILEMVWMFVSSGRTELRVGLVWGPFSPLYGFGACLLTMVLWNFRTAPRGQVFVLSALLGGGLEQTTGMLMENLFHAQSWTYLGLPDAITQWIAWRFIFAWGVIGLVWCRVVMPEVIYRIGEPTTRAQVVIVTVMTVLLIVDMLATVFCFYRKAQRDAGIPPSNPVDAYVDARFNDEFIANRFQNLVVGQDLEPNK